MAAPTELEIKLELPSGRAVRRADLPAPLQARDAIRDERLVSVYFDTDRLTLARHRMTLRVRRIGRDYVQTIKAGDGLFERGEWETAVASDRPDLKAARQTPLKTVLSTKKLKRLHAVFETRVRRRTHLLRTRTGHVALAVDHGNIDTGWTRRPLHEAELELKGGDRAELIELARRFAHATSAELALKSKSERGYELIEGKTDSAARAESLTIAKRSPAADAFRIIAGSCLKQVVANKPAARNANADGVHQMRVGLRRLRAAMAVFSDILPDRSRRRINDELKWLTDELGPARQLEVLLTDVVKPMLTDGGDGAAEVAMLSRELWRERQQALKRAAAAVNSARFRELAFEVVSWIELDAWKEADDLLFERGSEPVEILARRELQRRWKKIRKRGRSLAKLDPRKRHKLRIKIKKLRYAQEFFQAVFAGNASGRRRRIFATALHGLQDALGDLNDIAAHEAFASSIANSGAVPASRRSHRAFAAGLISGHEEARVADAMKAAEQAYASFRDAKPFW